MNASAAKSNTRSSVRANSARHLRLVDTHARDGNDAASARRTPALAVWRLERTSTRALPAELARRLIAHYSDRGQLILAATGASTAPPQARRLGRRALPFNAQRRSGDKTKGGCEAVDALRPNEHAQLVLVCVNGAVDAQRLGERAARLSTELERGGFLVLALERDTRAPLGAIVRACQQHGLQYWQHVIAIDPVTPQTEPPGANHGAPDNQDSVRSHRDLLVFRRPSDAAAVAAEAVAITERAA